MSSGTHLLLFHLGPVQSFIAEARRTRDLWIGSFILSWLSGQAMAAITKEGGDILVPVTDGNALFEAISKGTACEYLPSLPHQFTAKVPADFDPELCRTAVFEAWRKLSDRVYADLVAKALPSGADKVAIHQRWLDQTTSPDGKAHPLWEIYWVKGEESRIDDLGGALARRKSWRSLPAIEPGGGDFCSMMPRFRELSGLVGQSSGTSELVRSDPRQQPKAAFWQDFRTGLSDLLKEGQDKDAELLEIRPGEALSPVSLVKRLAPRLPPKAIKEIFGWLPPSHVENAKSDTRGEKRLLCSYRPSTAALAATHWIARAQRLAPAQLQEFSKTIKNAASWPLQTAERYRVCAALEGNPAREIDGKLFYTSYLDVAASRFGGRRGSVPEDQESSYLDVAASRFGGAYAEPGLGDADKIAVAQKALGDLSKTETNGVSMDEPSGFYAILKADGDHAGTIVSDPERGKSFAKALSKFSSEMPERLVAHNGELIYAGGDDVLALLPLEDALSAARDVRRCFVEAVKDVPPPKDGSGGRPTLSAAVLFVDSSVELVDAFQRVEHLLSLVAKEENGRDSLAISIERRGGEGPEWASRWSDGEGDAVAVFQGTAADPALRAAISNRFVYGINARLPGLLVPHGQDGYFLPLKNDDDFDRLMHLIDSSRGRGPDRSGPGDIKRLRPLIERHFGSGEIVAAPSLDGLLILRFLCREWRKLAPDEGRSVAIDSDDSCPAKEVSA